jgi:hypothetical protein
MSADQAEAGLLELASAEAKAAGEVALEVAATQKAIARALVVLAAEIGRQPGPDSLRARLGSEDALLIAQAAGISAAGIHARWAGAAPARPAQQKTSIWDDDPMHDGRVMNAQLAPDGNVRQALREVATDMSNPRRAQRASLALDYLAAGRMSLSDALTAVEVQLDRDCRSSQRGGLPVPLGVSAGPDGVPRQRSAVHQDVAPLASEEVY